MTMLVGPFTKMDEAQKFSENWKAHTRGIESKIDRGLKISLEDKIPVYYDEEDKKHQKSSKRKKC